MIINMTGKKCESIVYDQPYISPHTALSRAIATYYNPSIRVTSMEHVRRDLLRIANETYEKALKKGDVDPSKKVLVASNFEKMYERISSFYKEDGWEVIPVHLLTRPRV